MKKRIEFKDLVDEYIGGVVKDFENHVADISGKALKEGKVMEFRARSKGFLKNKNGLRIELVVVLKNKKGG